MSTPASGEIAVKTKRIRKRRVLCTCGRCNNCRRRAEYARRVRPLRPPVSCRCGRPGCDCARWEAIFERNHGPAARDYYSGLLEERSAGRSPQSSLSGRADLPDVSGVRIRSGEGGADNGRWKSEMFAFAQLGRILRESR